MFIIPAVGMTKALMAVTISLHPAAHQAQASYTVKQGDTLSAIAAHTYGNAANWPAVWWPNRHQMPNPNVIAAGQRLRLPTSGQTWSPVSASIQRCNRLTTSSTVRHLPFQRQELSVTRDATSSTVQVLLTSTFPH